MSILESFRWLEMTALGKAINESLYAFAYIEALHLLALAVLGGAVLLVDLRLMGLVMTDQPVTQIYRITKLWFRWSLVLILITGFLLFISLAGTKYYGHTYFWVKMYFLAAAILFTFIVRNRVAQSPAANSPMARLVGFVSIFLWAGVGFAGKAIGYIS
jgi:hypothetical protein